MNEQAVLTQRVLLTGAGGAAAVAFWKALQHQSQVTFYMADMSPYSSGLYLVPASQRRLVKAGKDPEFIPHLYQMCCDLHIDVLIPTVDVELLAIAEHQDLFSRVGIQVVNPSAAALRICTDKYQLMAHLHHRFPLCYFSRYQPDMDLMSIPYPVIAKPCQGSGSEGIVKLNGPEDVVLLQAGVDYLLQEYLPGAEYSVDVYSGVDSVLATVVRERNKVDSGIAVISSTVRDAELETLAANIAEAVGLRYVANIQFKRDRHGQPKLLEINPRFPGTMSLTVAAGVNMPEMCLHEAAGLPLNSHYPFEEISMVRTWHETFIQQGELNLLAGGP